MTRDVLNEDSEESSDVTHPSPTIFTQPFFYLSFKRQYFTFLVPIYYNMILRNNISMLRIVHKYQLNK